MSIRAMIFLLINLLYHTLFAQGTRLLREPAISDKYIAFGYANDLWVVNRDGGEARRLTSSPGTETAPHFSPDGRLIAFTGTYAGNSDVYVLEAAGGEPRRLTYHPGFDGPCGWTADGKQILIISSRTSVPVGIPQLWTLPVAGGLPDRLPIPSAMRALLFSQRKTARL